MNRPILLAYQLLIGLSDTLTGALLIVAPEFTLRMMHLHPPPDALPFLSFVGAFVFSVGIACLYGAWIVLYGGSAIRLEMIWLLTAITRSSVAIFVVSQMAHRRGYRRRLRSDSGDWPEQRMDSQCGKVTRATRDGKALCLSQSPTSIC